MPGQNEQGDEVENYLEKLEYTRKIENTSNFNEIVSQIQFPVIHFKTL